ncbi:MAG: hypothetical protein OEY89_02460 [Gammaproteobacteria bacterium]|nr:hypothetical protein [Gammaproteobacteria bacterium]
MTKDELEDLLDDAIPIAVHGPNLEDFHFQLSIVHLKALLAKLINRLPDTEEDFEEERHL